MRRDEPFYRRLQRLCFAVGIDNPGQLAIAIARYRGTEVQTSADVSRTSTTYWWKGEREPSLEMLRIVLLMTGANGHWLVTGEGDMFIGRGPNDVQPFSSARTG